LLARGPALVPAAASTEQHAGGYRWNRSTPTRLGACITPRPTGVTAADDSTPVPNRRRTGPALGVALLQAGPRAQALPQAPPRGGREHDRPRGGRERAAGVPPLHQGHGRPDKVPVSCFSRRDVGRRAVATRG